MTHRQCFGTRIEVKYKSWQMGVVAVANRSAPSERCVTTSTICNIYGTSRCIKSINFDTRPKNCVPLSQLTPDFGTDDRSYHHHPAMLAAIMSSFAWSSRGTMVHRKPNGRLERRKEFGHQLVFFSFPRCTIYGSKVALRFLRTSSWCRCL